MSISDPLSRANPRIRYRSGVLHVEDVSVERIVRSVGTPAYIYSSASILDQLNALEAALGAADHLICYAMKANSNGAVCRLLSSAGAGADVVSGGELYRALGAGFPPERIVFSGVGKTEGEIAAALRARILALNLESFEEMDAVSRVARRLKRKAFISVRVNPDVDAGTHHHIATGRADSKFGVNPRDALLMLKQASANRWLDPIGLQCHLGSQIVHTKPYISAIRILLSLVSKAHKAGIQLKFIDIGGGMGVMEAEEFPLADWAVSVLAALKHHPRLRLLIEPGRFLVADSGLLVGRVLYRKKAAGSRFVIVDVAMNDLIRPALYGALHPIVPVRRRGGGAVLTNVAGPVCETADFLARGVRLPLAQPGDLLALMQTGAYGFSMSSQYNSRLRPPEVLVEGGRYRVVRSRETIKDLIRLER